MLRTDYYMSFDSVSFVFYTGGRTVTNVDTSGFPDRIKFIITFQDGTIFEHESAKLFAPVDLKSPRFNVSKLNVTVSFSKVDRTAWPSQDKLIYPNSKGKDWSLVPIEDVDDRSPEEKSRAEMVYHGGYDEDSRRAMNKAFVESGGTVLCNYWDRVKDTNVHS